MRLILCVPYSTGAVLRANEVIGIDLGTTNSCVAVMEGKVCLGLGLRLECVLTAHICPKRRPSCQLTVF